MMKRFSWLPGTTLAAALALLLAAGLLAPALRAQEEGAKPPETKTVVTPPAEPANQETEPSAKPAETKATSEAPAPGSGEEKAAAKADQIRRILETTSPGASSEGPAGAPAAGGARKSDAEAIAVVEKYLQAIGGRENLAKIKDSYTKFRNVKYSATAETEAVIALYIKRGKTLSSYREEWEIKDFKIGNRKLSFVQIYNGDLMDGWVKMFNTVSPLEGRTLSVFVWDKHIDDFFVNWEKNGYTLHHVAAETLEGVETDVIKVVDFTGRQTQRYFFSRETGLIVKKEWYDEGGPSRDKREQYYRRYTPIAFSDGSGISIKFPLHLEILVNGDLDTERIYTGVKFNSSLSDDLFAQPEGKPFEEREMFEEEEGEGEAGGDEPGAGGAPKAESSEKTAE
ncbi:MAG: hypothetical protein JXA90_13040 [Planctomycetes bacterium]|nr:hypothetical protein [Planctomycetota bacterium]